MSWEVVLKAPKHISILMEVYRATPETWSKAKSIDKPNWDLLNSYVLALIKTVDKPIEYYVAKAREWVEKKSKLTKAFDFKKLPGASLDKWLELLELSEMASNFGFNKLVTDGVRFANIGATKSMVEDWKTGRIAARRIASRNGFSSRSPEDRKRRQEISDTFDAILPTLQKVFATSKSGGARGATKERSKNRGLAINVVDDASSDLQTGQEVNWEDLEDTVSKYFRGKNLNRKNLRAFLVDLDRKDRNNVRVIRANLPDGLPALGKLFKEIKQVNSSGDYDVVNIDANKALDFIKTFNHEKKYKGHRIRALHIEELDELIFKTRNKRWVNNLLVKLMQQVGDLKSLGSIDNWLQTIEKHLMINEQVFKDKFKEDRWEEYDLGSGESSKSKFLESLSADLTEVDSDEYKEWKKFIDDKKASIKTIRESVPTAFVKFIGELVQALDGQAKGEQQKELSEAFLEAYSPEDASEFISGFQSASEGGFGVEGSVLPPIMREGMKENSRYAARTLPQSGSKYSKMVEELYNVLVSEKELERFDELSYAYDAWVETGNNRVFTREYHLSGVADTGETPYAKGVEKFSGLQKALALLVYDAYVNGDDVHGSNGIFQSKVAGKLRVADLHFVEIITFLRMAQEMIVSSESGIEGSLKGLQSAMDSETGTPYEKLDKVNGEEPMFDMEIKNLRDSLNSSLGEIRDGLVKLVDAKLDDIVASPTVIISKTYANIMNDLVDLGFIRRADND